MDIVSIGEPLMELSNTDKGIYKEGFGGDTSNFLMAAARQGVSTAYFTKIGQDTFGNSFMKLWESENVDTSYIKRMKTAHTGLYFITYTEKGHEFSYFRAGSAASTMTPEEVPEDLIASSRLLHISGISQAISNSACDAVFEAVKLAKKHNVIVTYDPNVRLKLWSWDRAKAIINATVPYSDIFMPSLEDAETLTGMSGSDKITDYYHSLGVSIVVLKLGKNGVMVSDGKQKKIIPGYVVETVDQTGAGDTFDGAFCARYVKGATPFEAAQYANAAAALSTKGYGAVTPIPREKEVEDFLSLQETLNH